LSRTLAYVVLCVILLAGCDSGDDEPETVQRGSSCDLYLTDQGVSVRFAGERAARVCDEWLADRDGSWSRAAGAAADSSFERVCVVFREGTGAALYATGEPGSYRAAAATCSGLAGDGWSRLNPPTGQRARSEPSRFQPVRCAEGRCSQEGKDVAQPAEGDECGEGWWTYVGISSDGQAGVYRCLTDPKPGARVVCDSYNERCRQRSYAVRHPEPGAACGPEGMEWAEADTLGSQRVYRCTG
jgi:hypothetical protein